jgi:hypothetical protein
MGGVIYVFFRTTEPVFIKWIYSAGANEWIHMIREKSQDLFSQNIHEWILYSLPNGLWAFAYSFLITGIWWNHPAKIRYLWITSIPVLVFGFEALQYLQLVPGTFCVNDILFGLLGIGIGIVTGIKPIKHKYYEKAST